MVRRRLFLAIHQVGRKRLFPDSSDGDGELANLLQAGIILLSHKDTKTQRRDIKLMLFIKIGALISSGQRYFNLCDFVN